jgi:hypothetical protein
VFRISLGDLAAGVQKSEMGCSDVVGFFRNAAPHAELSSNRVWMTPSGSATSRLHRSFQRYRFAFLGALPVYLVFADVCVVLLFKRMDPYIPDVLSRTRR